jgi:hypothetical protein
MCHERDHPGCGTCSRAKNKNRKPVLLQRSRPHVCALHALLQAAVAGEPNGYLRAADAVHRACGQRL